MSENFRTQARLLASSRTTGFKATALDTGNKFESRGPALGWAQLVPVDGIAGEPLVVFESRSLATFDAPSRLLPDDAGTPGQLLATAAAVIPAWQTRDAGTAALLPLDYKDGLRHVAYSLSIPGGQLGPNGFIRIMAVDQAVTAANLTTSFNVELSGIGVPFVATSAALTGSASTYCTRYTVLIKNNNSETAQLLFCENNTTRAGVTVFGTSTAGVGSVGIDTTAAVGLEFTIQASAATATFASLMLIHVEFGYIA